MREEQSLGCLEVGSVIYEVVGYEHYIFLIDHDEFQDIPDISTLDLDEHNIPSVRFDTDPPAYDRCDAETEAAFREFVEQLG